MNERGLAALVGRATEDELASLADALTSIVWYTLYDRGAVVDEYSSVPEYRGPLPPGDVIALGANPTVVARLTGADPARVRQVARTAASPAELPPALELHGQIAELVGVRI